MMNNMIKRIKKIKCKYTIIETVIIIFVVGLSAVTFSQVLTRYILKSPPIWTEELARFILIWLSFISAAYTIKVRQTISVEILHNFLEEKKNKTILFYYKIITTLLMISFSLILIKYGFEFAITISSNISPGLGLKMTYIYLSLPIASILIVFYLVKDLICIVLKK